MTCNSVGVVITDEKPVFQIVRAINGALEASGAISISDAEIVSFADYVTIDFNHNVDGARMLSVHFDCDNDYEDEVEAGSKVIVSLGVFGHGPKVIYNICARLAQFGRVYYTANDCTDKFELFG